MADLKMEIGIQDVARLDEAARCVQAMLKRAMHLVDGGKDFGYVIKRDGEIVDEYRKSADPA